MTLIGAAVDVLPSKFRDWMVNSPFHEAYKHLQTHTASLTYVGVGTTAGRVQLIAPEKSLFATRAYRDNEYEPLLTDELVRRLTSDDVFFDIGSQYGYFTVLASKVGVPNECLHAFEANRFSYSVLIKNLAEETRTARTWVGNETTRNHLAIDNYVVSNDLPTVVKIDVEGDEYDVLRGMTDVLKNNHPQLYIEIHPQFLPEEIAPEDIFNNLKYYGYGIEVADHRAANSTWESLNCTTLSSDNTYLIRTGSDGMKAC